MSQAIDTATELSAADIAEIHAAVRAIWARCDGTRTLDGQGFNRQDVWLGHVVAEADAASVDSDTAVRCWRMLKKYRRQLAEEGIDFTALPHPPGMQAGPAKARRALNAATRSVVIRGEVAEVRFPFDETLNRGVRALPGSHGGRDGTGRFYWTADVTDELDAFAARHGFTITQGLPMAPVQAAVRAPRPAPSAPRARGTLSALADGTLRVRLAGYRPELLDRLRVIPGRTTHRDGAGRFVHDFGPGALRPLRRFAADHGLAVDPDVEQAPEPPHVSIRYQGGRLYALPATADPELVELLRRLGGIVHYRGHLMELGQAAELVDGLDQIGCANDFDWDGHHAQVARYEANIAASKALDADLPDIEGLAVELYPFQRAGVAYMIENKRCVLADEMGLGKTISALAALQALDAFPAMILCPATLKLNWMREVRRALPGRHIVMLKGSKPRSFGLMKPDIVIMNYDIGLNRPPKSQRVEGVEDDTFGWAKSLVEQAEIIDGFRIQGLVFDEGHLIKEHDTLRAQATRILGDAVPDDGPVFDLTATPVLNERREFASQLDALGRLDEFGGPAAVANDPNIRDHLCGSGAMVRRRTADVVDLPPVVWVPVALEGDPKAMAEYRHAEAKLLEFLAECARAAALEDGTDPDQAAKSARMRAKRAEHLVRIGVLKRLAARAKLPAAKRWIKETLAAGDKMLLFAHHNDVLDSVQATFRCDAVRGGQSQAARQAAVDRFQGGQGDLLALGLTAGGIGLTLTAAKSVAFLEQGWTPAAHDQAVARCHGRLSDLHGAVAYVLFVEGTIDDWIAGLLDEKRLEVGNATDGTPLGDDPDSGASIAGALIDRLTAAGLAGVRSLAT